MDVKHDLKKKSLVSKLLIKFVRLPPSHVPFPTPLLTSSVYIRPPTLAKITAIKKTREKPQKKKWIELSMKQGRERKKKQ